LPIKDISLSEQQPFIALADRILTLNADLQAKRQRFLKRLSDNFDKGFKPLVITITSALEHFDTLEFSQFLAELKKQTRGHAPLLSLNQQDEWAEYFNVYKSECTTFVQQIEATDKEIDRMVYALYGLTEEEIKIIVPGGEIKFI
jgi:hypothetical protein